MPGSHRVVKTDKLGRQLLKTRCRLPKTNVSHPFRVKTGKFPVQPTCASWRRPARRSDRQKPVPTTCATCPPNLRDAPGTCAAFRTLARRFGHLRGVAFQSARRSDHLRGLSGHPRAFPRTCAAFRAPAQRVCLGNDAARCRCACAKRKRAIHPPSPLRLTQAPLQCPSVLQATRQCSPHNRACVLPKPPHGMVCSE
jgi:hypothetical protein